MVLPDVPSLPEEAVATRKMPEDVNVPYPETKLNVPPEEYAAVPPYARTFPPTSSSLQSPDA